MHLPRLFSLIYLVAFSVFCHAEIILIPFEKDEIPTAYWAHPNSKATLIFLPGGDGSFGIANKPNPQPSWILKSVNKPESEETLDLVFMDSRTSLGWRNGDVAPRYASPHLDRVEAVIDFYQKKTNRPIFLIGHSNGAISVASFLNRSPDNPGKIGGAIFSGSRNERLVSVQLNLPLLVLHHKDDPNSWTTPKNAEKLFLDLKTRNASTTEFKLVEGGYDEGNPAISGRHMYAGALDQAAGFVRTFIYKNIK